MVFQASHLDEWIKALQTFKNDSMLKQCMGKAGRAKIENSMFAVVAPKLAQLLHQAKEITDVRHFWFLGQGSTKSTDEIHVIIQQMSDTLVHRGPDDRGSWVDADLGIALVIGGGNCRSSPETSADDIC
jgi:glutamine cyclotransferase